MKLLILGATGGPRRPIGEGIRKRRWRVRARVYSTATTRARLPGTELKKGDALDALSLMRAVAGCDAVVSALGPTRISLFRKVTTLWQHTAAVCVWRGVR